MTFDEIYDFLEGDLIDNRLDELIVKKIIEAETDWSTPLQDLDQFIEALENEIGGETSKENLNKLLKRYNSDGLANSAWNSESICSLLEIFELTGYKTLKNVFSNLSIRLKLQIPRIQIFEEIGYPTIKIHENEFEIKAIDFSKFRKFKYLDLKEVKLVDYREKWWFKLYSLTSFSAQIFSNDDPVKLKVFKKKGAEWEYKASSKHNERFYGLIKEINFKIKGTIAKTI